MTRPGVAGRSAPMAMETSTDHQPLAPSSPHAGRMASGDWILVGAALVVSFAVGAAVHAWLWGPLYWTRGRSLPEDFVTVSYGVLRSLLAGGIVVLPVLLPARTFLFGGAPQVAWLWAMRSLLLLVIFCFILEPALWLLRASGLAGIFFGEETVWFGGGGFDGIGGLLLFFLYAWSAIRITALMVLHVLGRTLPAPQLDHARPRGWIAARRCTGAFLIGAAALGVYLALVSLFFPMLVFLPLLSALAYTILRQFLRTEDLLLRGRLPRHTGGK